jgi:hypothetical protein
MVRLTAHREISQQRADFFAPCVCRVVAEALLIRWTRGSPIVRRYSSALNHAMTKLAQGRNDMKRAARHFARPEAASAL